MYNALNKALDSLASACLSVNWNLDSFVENCEIMISSRSFFVTEIIEKAIIYFPLNMC